MPDFLPKTISSAYYFIQKIILREMNAFLNQIENLQEWKSLFYSGVCAELLCMSWLVTSSEFLCPELGSAVVGLDFYFCKDHPQNKQNYVILSFLNLEFTQFLHSNVFLYCKFKIELS